MGATRADITPNPFSNQEIRDNYTTPNTSAQCGSRSGLRSDSLVTQSDGQRPEPTPRDRPAPQHLSRDLARICEVIGGVDDHLRSAAIRELSRIGDIISLCDNPLLIQEMVKKLSRVTLPGQA